MDMAKILKTKQLLTESESHEESTSEDLRDKLKSIHDQLKHSEMSKEVADFDAEEIHKTLMALADDDKNEDHKADLQNLAKFIAANKFDVAEQLVDDILIDMDKMSGSTWFNDKDNESSMWAKDEMDFPSEKHFEESLSSMRVLSGQKKVNESAPTDQEEWVKKNKKKFKDEYGDKKGEEILYKTAWKKHDLEEATRPQHGGTKRNAVIDLWDGHGKTPAQIAKQLKMEVEKVKDIIKKFKERTKLDESEVCADQACSSTAMNTARDNFSINTYLNMNNGVEDFNVTINASNGKADELLDILRLSGLSGQSVPEVEVSDKEDNSEMMTDQVPAAEYEVIDSEDEVESPESQYGFGYGTVDSSEESAVSPEDEVSDDEDEEENILLGSKVTESEDKKYVVTVTFDLYAGHPVTRFIGSKNEQKQLVADKENAIVFDNLEMAQQEAIDAKHKFASDPDWNDAKISIKPYAYLGESFEDSDYEMQDKFELVCSECGNPVSLDHNDIATHMDADGEIDYDQDADHVAVPERFYPTDEYYDGDYLKESLESASSKERGKEKTWQNEPNEQIAGWRAVVDDTQGLSKPHDMFNPDRGRDNVLKIAQNKEKPKLHENEEINEMANKLYENYQKLKESEDICPKCGFDPCQCSTKHIGKDSPFTKVKVNESHSREAETAKTANDHKNAALFHTLMKELLMQQGDEEGAKKHTRAGNAHIDVVKKMGGGAQWQNDVVPNEHGEHANELSKYANEHKKVSESKKEIKEEMEEVEKECESCGTEITSGKLCADCRRTEKNTRKSPKFKKNG